MKRLAGFFYLTSAIFFFSTAFAHLMTFELKHPGLLFWLRDVLWPMGFAFLISGVATELRQGYKGEEDGAYNP